MAKLNQEDLNRLEEKGFQISENVKYVSIMYLLSTMLESYEIEYSDYLKKYGLLNNFRNDITTLNRNFKVFHDKVKKLVDDEGKAHLFADFDELRGLIETFLKK